MIPPMTLRTYLHSTKKYRGMTLIEIVVVIAIMGLVAVVAAPTLSGVFALKQQAAVNELGQTYIWLQEEASLRNVSFRIAFNLDRHTWKIEMGDPEAVVFASAEEAKEYQAEKKRKMRRYTKRRAKEEGIDLEEELGSFEQFDDPALKSEHQLPDGISFLFVYTPQYTDKGVRPNRDMPDEAEDEAIAYSHIFSDGTVEHTIIRIVEGRGDQVFEDEGYSLEVDPLGGRITMTDEEIDPRKALSWLPDEGPDFR